MAGQASPTSVHKVIFDTEVLIWYLRGLEKARRFIGGVAHEQRALSSLSFTELLQGCRNQQEAREVKVFVSENISLVIHPDEIISRRAIALLERHYSHGIISSRRLSAVGFAVRLRQRARCPWPHRYHKGSGASNQRIDQRSELTRIRHG
jgi:predicted nucleic acid-binding protein